MNRTAVQTSVPAWVACMLAGLFVDTARAQALPGTAWNVVELYGAPVTGPASDRQPHLVFGADGRLSGADGCNRLTGPYTIKGEAVTFGQIASTQMACPGTDDAARRFRGALQGTTRWRLVKNRLEFYGAAGTPLAVFAPRPQPPAGAAALSGTTWQLVKFVGGDGRTLTPADPSKYTITFAADGTLTARVDCNRGRGSWTATPPSRLELGPLALTRVKCPDGSLHDQIVKQWANIRSFVLKDRRLFLSLAADGGTYEWAPVAPG